MKEKTKVQRIFSLILIIMLILSFAGCQKKKMEGSSEGENDFDIKVASNLIDIYMKDLTKEDYQNIRNLLSKELQKNSKETNGNNELKVRGYSIDETSEIGKTGFFKVKIARMNLNKPVASLDESSIKVIKEGSDYKISEIKNETEKDAFLENNTLRIRSKNNIKTNLLIDASSIPQYAFSKDDKANLYKQAVPRDNFGVMNFGYEGERIAISTYNKDSYIGIIKIDESQATQGGGGGQDKDQGGGQGKGKQGPSEGGQQGGREKPMGKDMQSLDYLKDSKVESMTFSTGEKFVVVQYNKTNLGRSIRIYSTDSGDLIKFKFEDEYPIEKFDVNFSSFDKENVYYEVVNKNENDKSEANIVGKYKLGLKDFKAKKL